MPGGETVSDRGEQLCQAHEFAKRAGVTVRTLHHYDQLGLLKPRRRSAAGFRLYGEGELVRLQQIALLKFVGFPLQEIKRLLDRSLLDLPTALRLQRAILAERRRQIEQADAAIAHAERLLVEKGALDWAALKCLIEVMEMQPDWDWVKQYYTAEQLAELAQRGTPEALDKGQRDWAMLIRDVEAAVAGGESPTSESAQALAARWRALIEAFTGGDPAIATSLNRLYADRANWPATASKPYPDAVGKFIEQALAARGSG
jgi:DNA-binding transcriptional MerR regulator